MAGTFTVGEWTVLPELNSLERNGRMVRLEPKVMQVLMVLCEHCGHVVSKEQIFHRVWSDTFVSDEVLTRAASELRKVFEDSPQQPKYIQTIPKGGYRLVATVVREPANRKDWYSENWRMLTAATAVLLLAAVASFYTLKAKRLGASKAAITSLAVLPLANLSGDPEQEYFADGMTEELITDFARIGTLRVISRTSVMGYKGKNKPLPEIARELNVDVIVEGTVQRSGGRVRIAAQLIDARNDQHLWTGSYERDLREVLVLQDEVASRIAEEISVKLTPEEQEHARASGAHPIDPEAHEAYLQGLYFWNKLTENDVKKSIGYFERAIQLAPDYAPAYSALAFSYTLLASEELAPSRENYAKAKELALKAIALDENRADAHAALGFILCYGDWDWHAAEVQFKRANALEPNGDVGHHVYALYLGDMGRTEEAISEMKKSLTMDPLSVLTLKNLGLLYAQAGQPEKAIEQFRKILELDPKSVDAHGSLGRVYSLQGKHTQAIAEWREAKTLSGDSPWNIIGLGRAYAAAGKSREAQEMLEEVKRLSRRQYVAPYGMASFYAYLGDKKQTLFWLEKALDEHNDALVSLKVDPDFASLRNDSHFREILRRIGLP